MLHTPVEATGHSIRRIKVIEKVDKDNGSRRRLYWSSFPVLDCGLRYRCCRISHQSTSFILLSTVCMGMWSVSSMTSIVSVALAGNTWMLRWISQLVNQSSSVLEIVNLLQIEERNWRHQIKNTVSEEISHVTTICSHFFFRGWENMSIWNVRHEMSPQDNAEFLPCMVSSIPWC